MKAVNIYKNVDNDIEFKGLRGRYFYWSIGGGVGTIFFAMILYVFGVPVLVVLALLVIGLATSYFLPNYYNQLNGKWGHIKNEVSEKMPDYVTNAIPFEQFIDIKTVKR